MKEEKDELNRNDKSNEKALCQAVIYSPNNGILKNGYVIPADESRQVYETPHSDPIFHPFKKARGSPCKGPPGHTQSPGIDGGYFTGHPPSREKQQQKNTKTRQ
jgi:hypothetical protein